MHERACSCAVERACMQVRCGSAFILHAIWPFLRPAALTARSLQNMAINTLLYSNVLIAIFCKRCTWATLYLEAASTVSSAHCLPHFSQCGRRDVLGRFCGPLRRLSGGRRESARAAAVSKRALASPSVPLRSPCAPLRSLSMPPRSPRAPRPSVRTTRRRPLPALRCLRVRRGDQRKRHVCHVERNAGAPSSSFTSAQRFGL